MAEVVVWGLDAVLGEIPLFGPGAGSAASAGMTEVGKSGLDGGGGAGMTAREGPGATERGVEMASEVVWGLGAASDIGFGPQIKFGATDLGAGVAEV